MSSSLSLGGGLVSAHAATGCIDEESRRLALIRHEHARRFYYTSKYIYIRCGRDVKSALRKRQVKHTGCLSGL